MSVPPAVAAALAQALTNDKVQDLATNLWTKIFQKDEIKVVDDGRRQLLDLIGNIPTNEELAAAFSALEARLSAASAADAQATRSLVMRAALGLAAIQVVSLLIVLVLRF